MMDPPPLSELDINFEPQTRARSNTWPLPRPENYVEDPPTIKCEEVDRYYPLDNKCSVLVGPGIPSLSGGQLKKNSSRRNAWGNLSYADLITQAISSAPDTRLTLSQIYEWMVHNIPYFKDKGDSNSSAGWKNSIRHNLSLHNRFMRVQNEGTGKSSWWMINPDAKPGKSARRRATSMETSKFEKRRGRVKKKVEALRNGVEPTPSPSSSVSESLDFFSSSPLQAFQLSPDFRPRTSSNASSCGRLSPIPACEPDWVTYHNAEQLAGIMEQARLTQEQDPTYNVTPTPYQPSPTSTSLQQQQQQPPPPYHQTPQYNQPFSPPQICPLHRVPSCTCNSSQNGAVYPQNISPGYTTHSSSPSPPNTAVMNSLMNALNPSTIDDLNLNFETLQGGFDCNVEEMINYELNLEGRLDFNFGSTQTQQPPLVSDWRGAK